MQNNNKFSREKKTISKYLGNNKYPILNRFERRVINKTNGSIGISQLINILYMKFYSHLTLLMDQRKWLQL